jgi:hypothetical protein
MHQQLLKISAFFIFIARAYQFYFFGAPFRSVFWDESLLSPIVVGLFNYSWYDYATSPVVNKYIEGFTKVCSFILVASALSCLFWHKLKATRPKKIILSLGVVILLFLGFCLVKSKNYDVLQFFELSIQIAVPMVFLFSKNLARINEERLTLWLKIAIVLTFVPHGLFAMGLIYVPGHFIDMTIQILGFSETQSKQFLFIVGALDILLSVLIFVPKVAKYALSYAIFWGFLTALSRLISSFNSDFLWLSLHNYTYLVLYRLPHAIIPLIVYLLIPKTKILTKKLTTNEN